MNFGAFKNAHTKKDIQFVNFETIGEGISKEFIVNNTIYVTSKGLSIVGVKKLTCSAGSLDSSMVPSWVYIGVDYLFIS